MPNTNSSSYLVNVNNNLAYPLERDEYWLGRSGNNDIRMSNDPLVSRRHAVVRRIEKEFVIEDYGSRNGTFINGEPTSGRQTLRVGDRIFLGNTCFVFKKEESVTVTHSIQKIADKLASGIPKASRTMALWTTASVYRTECE